MSGKHLLYLSSSQLSAWRWEKGRLFQEGAFSADDASLAAFAAYLERGGNTPLWLLTNAPDEAYRRESIPYLRGRDRQAVIERRLAQAFFGDALTTVVSLGFEKTERKNENLLFAALTRPGDYQPWLDAIARGKSPLAGLYALPQLSCSLLAGIPRPGGRCLLLTVQDQSLRQSLVVDGNACFSRLTPLPCLADGGHGDCPAGFSQPLARTLADEAARLHQYLLGQGLVGRDEALNVHLAVPPAALADVAAVCADTPVLRFHPVDSHALARRLGLQTPLEDLCGEALWLHLLARTPPGRQFAPPALRRDFRLGRLRRALQAAGFAALAASLVFAGVRLAQSHGLRQESEQLKAQASLLERRYEAIAATFPKPGIGHENLRALMARQAALQVCPASPAALLTTLSRALNAAPAITIEHLDWRLADGASEAKPALADLADCRQEALTVRGHILLGGAPSPRQFVTALQGLTENLAADPAIQVAVVQHPYDMQSDAALKGGGDERGATPGAARPFTLRLQRRYSP